MRIRTSTLRLLPAQIALIIFVFYWHPIVSASQRMEKWDRIKSGMSVRQVENIFGRKADSVTTSAP
jgi:hypothetical protein